MKKSEMPGLVIIRFFVSVSAVLGIIYPAAGQDPKDKEKWGQGEIESVQYEIVVDRKITLPPASRNFGKIAPRPIEPVKQALSYEFKNLKFATADFSPTLRPLRLKTEELSKIYGNYVVAGVGNFAGLLLEGYATTKRDKSKFGGIKFNHNSYGSGPVDKKNSASSNTNVRLFGDIIGTQVTATGFADYENQSGYFYGYEPGKTVDRKSIAQDYSIFSLGGDIHNSVKRDFTYKLHTGFSFLNDKYQAKESELRLKGYAGYDLTNGNKLSGDVEYYLIARKDVLVEAKPRYIFKVAPSYRFVPIEKVTLSLGARVVAENDTLGKGKDIHVYPNIVSTYNLSKLAEVYASLSGDIDKVSLHTLSGQNMWVNSNIGLFNTNRSIEFQLGIRGNVSGRFSYGLGTSLSNLKNLYFYQNSRTDPSKFDAYYDRGNTRRSNFFLEAGYSKEQIFQSTLRGDYFIYNSSIIDQVKQDNKLSSAAVSESEIPLHLPSYRLTSQLHWNLAKKIALSSSLILQGGMKAIDFTKSDATKLVVVELKPAIDVNFKADYFISKQFSVFLKLDNIFSSSYPVFLNYPVRGFQAMGGITWSF